MMHSHYKEYLDALNVRMSLTLKENYDCRFDSEIRYSINTLGILLSELDDFDNSYKAYRKALVLTRRMYQKSPSIVWPKLLHVLNNLGNYYQKSILMPMAMTLSWRGYNTLRKVLSCMKNIQPPFIRSI